MKLIVIILLLFCLLSHITLFSQYNVPASVLGNGGSSMSGNGYIINGTLGQPVIGFNTSTSNKVYSGFWNSIQYIITGVIDEPGGNLSSGYYLGQSYPNPFNSRTTITFVIPRDSHIILSIFNVLGEQIVTLVNEKKIEGLYSVDWDASNFSSGTYYSRLNAEDKSETSVLHLIK